MTAAENLEAMIKLIQEMKTFQENDEIVITDGDPNPAKVYEREGLGLMWAEGGDYHPLNSPLTSQWAKDCYEGKLGEIKNHLTWNPNRLEQRESSLRLCRFHHVIAGARSINPTTASLKKHSKDVCFKVNENTDHTGCTKILN